MMGENWWHAWLNENSIIRLKIKEDEIVSIKSELDVALNDLENYNLSKSKSLEVLLKYNADKKELDENINRLEGESNEYLTKITLEEDKLKKNQIKIID